MVLLDVNVLVYAFRPDAPDHEAYVAWLEAVVNNPTAFGLSNLVCSGFIRITTHPKIFKPPTPLEDALEFIEDLRAQPNCVIVQPKERHWHIFTQLCRQAKAKGNLVSDAYHAALAIESGNEWITEDRDFTRFPDLRWRHPLG